jgi:hypothetical protein
MSRREADGWRECFTPAPNMGQTTTYKGKEKSKMTYTKAEVSVLGPTKYVIENQVVPKPGASIEGSPNAAMVTPADELDE